MCSSNTLAALTTPENISALPMGFPLKTIIQRQSKVVGIRPDVLSLLKLGKTMGQLKGCSIVTGLCGNLK